jgi:TolB-like protein
MNDKPFHKALTTVFILASLCPLVFASFPLPVQAADKRVAILPLKLYADESKAYLRQGLKTMFTSRLSGEGLEVIGDEALSPLLTDADGQGVTSSERAEELARRLDADYAVFGSVTSLGTGYSLDLSILDLTQQEPDLTRISEAVDEDRLIPKLDDVVYDFRAVIAGVDIRRQAAPMAPQEAPTGMGLFARPAETAQYFKPSGRQNLSMGVMSLDSGDLDGDGTAELVVLGREVLLIYTIKETGLELKDKFTSSTGEDFLKVSVGDMDRNGKAEIYLLSYYGSQGKSTILEWTGQFKEVDQRNGHLYAAENQNSGAPLLLYQDSNITDFFSGKIWTMEYPQGEQPQKKEAVKGLEDAQLYTLTLFDFDGDGNEDFIGLGEGGLNELARIHAWNRNGKRLWRSDEEVGGTNNAIRWGSELAENRSPRILLNSKLVFIDIDDDGKKELLATANVPIVRGVDFKLYTKGTVNAYTMTGGSFTEAYKTRTISYCITDMTAENNTLFMAIQKGKVTKFGSGTSRILWFK